MAEAYGPARQRFSNKIRPVSGFVTRIPSRVKNTMPNDAAVEEE
jgi:hypothetical protein